MSEELRKSVKDVKKREKRKEKMCVCGKEKKRKERRKRKEKEKFVKRKKGMRRESSEE
jgi:hypothetical protein